MRAMVPEKVRKQRKPPTEALHPESLPPTVDAPAPGAAAVESGYRLGAAGR